jgi:hypothetical protein
MGERERSGQEYEGAAAVGLSWASTSEAGKNKNGLCYRSLMGSLNKGGKALLLLLF